MADFTFHQTDEEAVGLVRPDPGSLAGLLPASTMACLAGPGTWDESQLQGNANRKSRRAISTEEMGFLKKKRRDTVVGHGITSGRQRKLHRAHVLGSPVLG